jgi:hypothetical protein
MAKYQSYHGRQQDQYLVRHTTGKIVVCRDNGDDSEY